jgi:hypothetical protein
MSGVLGALRGLSFCKPYPSAGSACCFCASRAHPRGRTALNPRLTRVARAPPTQLTLRSWTHSEENKRRTLQRSDIAAAISKTDIFDFLVDITGPPADGAGAEGAEGAAGGAAGFAGGAGR